MNTLPDQDLMCAQMAVSFTLSNPPADEVRVYSVTRHDVVLSPKVFLGQFPMKLFTTKEPLDVLSRFTADIEQIGKEIQER